jgi:hypothetical protein
MHYVTIPPAFELLNHKLSGDAGVHLCAAANAASNVRLLNSHELRSTRLAYFAFLACALALRACPTASPCRRSLPMRARLLLLLSPPCPPPLRAVQCRRQGCAPQGCRAFKQQAPLRRAEALARYVRWVNRDRS